MKSEMRLTIGTKLVGLIALLLAGSLAVLVWASTEMFVEDNTALIQQMNSDTAESLAIRMRETFKGYADKARILGTVLVQENLPYESRSRIIQGFFAKDRDFLAIVVHKWANTIAPAPLAPAVSPELVALGDSNAAKILSTLSATQEYSVNGMARGAIQLVLFRLPDGNAALAFGLPFIEEEKALPGRAKTFTHTLTAIIKHTPLTKAMGENQDLTSYLLDHRGRLLAHPDHRRAAAHEDLSQTGIVRTMLKSKTNNGQTRYKDPQGVWKLGSFKLLGFGGLGVISETPESKAFEAAENVKRRSLYFAVGILSIAFFTGFGFSRRLSKRINRLVEASYQISEGDFKIDVESKGHDEVSTLSMAFQDMAKGLEERDRLKQTFKKFHNQEIADKLLNGEVKLGGVRKEATIFFSDIRGFTSMAESMQPEEVVEMLNEYMTRMVSIIRAHNGIVDKYVGDAIMAIWGVPIGAPGGTAEDAHQAVQACLAMRNELSNLNQLRVARGQVPLTIGMGLNTGSVIAGNIGSDEKMEYTVIGDSVNLASRMESLTKERGTDLLVPKSIQEMLADKFIFESCQDARVKGKAGPIEIFKVKGYIGKNGKAVFVETPYSSYVPNASEKTSVLATRATDFLSPTQMTAALTQLTATMPPPLPEATATLTSFPPAEAVMPTQTAILPEKNYTGDVYDRPREWFAQVGKEIFGPFNEHQIRDGVARNRFDSQTLLANNRLGPWKALLEVSTFTRRPETLELNGQDQEATVPMEISVETLSEPTTVTTFEPTTVTTVESATTVTLASPTSISLPTIKPARSRSKLIESAPENTTEAFSPNAPQAQVIEFQPTLSGTVREFSVVLESAPQIESESEATTPLTLEPPEEEAA